MQTRAGHKLQQLPLIGIPKHQATMRLYRRAMPLQLRAIVSLLLLIQLAMADSHRLVLGIQTSMIPSLSSSSSRDLFLQFPRIKELACSKSCNVQRMLWL